MKKLVPWIRAFRLPFHTALLIPFVLGTVLAWSTGQTIKWAILSVGLVAVFLMTSNCFLANEYFDYETDKINRDYNPFTGGSRVLPEAALPRRSVLAAALVCMLGAMVLGLIMYLRLGTGALTIPLGASGMAAAYFYSARPVKLAYRGLGEISIGLGVGWLPLASGYYVQTGRLPWLPTLVALPYIFACTLLIWGNEFPDYTSDRLSNKRTLVVRLGREKAAWAHNGLVVLMWVSAIPIALMADPKISLVLLAPWLALSAWNVIAMARGQWRDGKEMKAVCARTILYTVILPLSLIGLFLWKGLSRS